MKIQDQLAKRRLELIARCNEQRKSLHLQSDRWKKTLSTEDMAHNALVRIKQYRPWLIGSAIAIILIKPRRIAALVRATTAAARTVRMAMPILQQVQRKLWQTRHPGRVQM